MALPKLDLPLYELELPSSGETISYRPFLVKEEKILMMAMESENEKEMINGVRQIVNNCVSDSNFDVDNAPLFDVEYILLHLRGVSMGGTVTLNYKNNELMEDGKVIIPFYVHSMHGLGTPEDLREFLNVQSYGTTKEI